MGVRYTHAKKYIKTSVNETDKFIQLSLGYFDIIESKYDDVKKAKKKSDDIRPTLIENYIRNIVFVLFPRSY